MRQAVAIVALVTLLASSGCAGVKPAARTVADIARDLCALVSSERHGISVQDAARVFCATERQLEPWLDELLAARKRAVEAAAADGVEP